jgi:glutaminyl-peptide cyclotransferase
VDPMATGPRRSSGKDPKTGRSLWLALPVGLMAAAVAVAVFPRPGLDEVNAEMAVTPAPIDGARAYKYLKQICDIGPRPAGSAANAKQRKLVAAHFEKQGATVREQPFTGSDPVTHERVDMVNLIGSWNPDRLERVVIGVHYDTRPHPDEDKDPAKRAGPFIGANDGASGVAMLMEIAHHLDKLQTPWGVDLVLFDGEELVYGGGNNQTGDYFLGSKEFAKQYADGVDTRKIKYRYSAGLVLDMIGDKNLNIDREPNSIDFAPGLVKDVWNVARQLKATAFRSREGRQVNDDHIPMNNGGIPTIDLIDFDYPHWHTSEDLPDKCSAASLEQVGKVVTGWLTQPKPKKPRRR